MLFYKKAYMWDTDVRSTSLTDGSTVVPDCYGRKLHCALDQKVRKLKSMVSNNEDITTELDKVTCRLVKIAMHTARRSQRPLTNRWMQCKLLDLLTLTEKTIEKKRQLTVDTNPLKAICYDEPHLKPEGALSKIMEDDTANEIVNKYRHLVRSSENITTSDNKQNRYFDALEDEFAKEILFENASSDYDYLDQIRSPSLFDIEPITAIPAYALKQYLNSNELLNPVLERTKARVDEDVTIMELSQNSTHHISSGDTDHSVGSIIRYKNKKNKKHKKITESKVVDIKLKRRKKHQNKTSHKNKNDDIHKHKDKTSTTRLIKKTVKKKSSYNILIKNCSNNMSTVNFGSYVLKAKKSIKQHSLPTRTSNSRPISKTLIELCKQEKYIDRKDCGFTVEDSITDSIAVSDNIDYFNTNIALTKESLLIDIIMEDKEETIALRRTIGTDAEEDSLTFEPENILGSMTNIMKLDSFSNKPDMCSDNVQSQNLFIFDINEPSTSKGVRHVSMDVQCGTDATNNYAMLSATTSSTKMPRMFNTGIRIGNSTSDMQKSIKNCDFSTSTNENSDSFKTITPRGRFVGITIKDSETTITEKNECETMTQAMETTRIVPSNPNCLNSTETKTLKPISSRLKMEDSVSEFCDSLESSRKSPSHFINLSKDTSELQMELSISKDVAVARNLSSKYVRPKLVNGGVYVHSYKDRRLSEDVVYQGEWQKYSPSTPKKGRSNAVAFKKVCDGANKKIRPSSKENLNASKVVKSKPIKQTPTCNLKDVKQERDKESKIEPIQRIPIPNNLKAIKCYRNPNKVASKLAANSMPSRSYNINKTTYVTKKPSGSFSVGKKDNESVSRPRKKSYIPLYLQRKLSKNFHHIISLESDSERKVTADKEKSIIDKIVDVVVTAENIKENLLKFACKPRENLSYIVFRNEVEANNNSSTDCEKPFNRNSSNDKITDESNRSLSPMSLNSSSGSSSHSIATVRLQTTPKLTSDRNHSTSFNKSNLVTRQTENTSLKNKKMPKRFKSAKRAQNKVFDNKENLPETSRQSKDSGKTYKSAFLKNKNIFRAQIATVNSQSINNITKTKSQTPNKSNIRIPLIPSSTKKQPASETSSKPSLTKSHSLKSRTSSSLVNKSVKDSDNSDIVVTPSLEDQNNTASAEIHENSVIINIVDHNLLSEWISTTHSDVVESHTSSILNAMRELVEDRLDFIENLSSNSGSAEVDTKMVILDEKNDSISLSQTTSFQDATSLNSSYGTVMEINDLDYSQLMELGNSFFDSVLYNEFDPVLGNDSTIGIADNQPNISNLEQLSFKSMTSASKLSDYYMAESSLNVLDALTTDMPSSNSVQDILLYERKTPLTMQNPAGTLAIQAFSGFSMNGPIAGDQPDHVNLIDSETGSVALEYARQATSEEVFISGRSSDSYESCQIDDETVVPNWLFQIISQQQSIIRQVQEEDEDEDEEEESEDLVPMQLPVVEPMFDINGNAVEPGMGAGAGAGDGRGIHSDHSQDSSGRGTSISSSATSSGPQSEAIIVDSTAFTAQYDLMREPLGISSVAVPVSLETADTTPATAESGVNSRNLELLNSSGDPQRAPDPAASDVDADVSSIDTDVPDSSDN